MNNQSPWSILQTIKTQLRSTEYNMTEVVTCLCGGDDMALTGKAIVGASGQYYNFYHTAGTSDYRVDVTQYLPETGTWDQTRTYTFDSLDSMLDYSDQYVSMSNVLLDLKQGVTSNQVIADICNSFQSSQNLSLSDIASLVNSSDLDISEKNRIMSYIKSAVNNSTIKSYGWMTVMQKIFEEGYGVADSGTTIMDKSKPFALQSIASTIINGITSVLSAVALGLKSAYGALLMVLAQLVSSLFSYISKVANNTVNTDLNSTTFMVKGPSKYCENFTNATINYVTSPIFHQLWGPYDIFSWIDDQSAITHSGHKINVNAFISVGFDVVKAINKLHNESWLHVWDNSAFPNTIYLRWNEHGDKYRWGKAIKQTLYNDPSMYLSQEECMAIISDEVKCTRYLYLLLFFDNMLNFQTADLDPFGVGDEVKYQFSSADDRLLAQYTIPMENNSDKKGDMVRAWTALFGRWASGSGSDISLNTNFPVANCTEFLQNWFNQYGTSQAENPLNYSDHTYGFISYTIREKDGSYRDTSYIAVLDTLYGWTPITAEGDLCEIVESIPTDRCITIPDMTWDKLAVIISFIAVAVAAACVAKKIATKILNKRFTAKRLADMRRLNEARELYSAFPNDQTAYDNFYKEVRRYNLKANLLGWNTYDPINNWFNENTSGTAFVGSIKDSQPSLLDKAQSAATSLSDITGVQIPGIRTGETNSISQVLQVIRGY